MPGIEPVVEENPDLVRVVELEPQTLWVRDPDGPAPYRVDEEALARARELPGLRLLHSVGNPVGGSRRPDSTQFPLLGTMATELATPWVSEHLAFNRAGRGSAGDAFATGFMLPPRQTAEGVARAVESIGEMQSGLAVPVAVETGVNYLRPRPDELPDGEFLGRVVDGAGCGLLLDLHNLWTNERNGRQPVRAVIDVLPLESVWEVHLAGGFLFRGYWLDAHSGAIPEPLVALAREVLPMLVNLGALIFEVSASALPAVGMGAVREQLQRLSELWQLAGSAPPTWTPAPPRSERGRSSADPSPERWEDVLGALVVGRSVERSTDGDLAVSLEEDPGTGILRDLVAEMRSSVIVSTLKLTGRLLLLALGQEELEELLRSYRLHATPRLFASDEAICFADFLSCRDLEVPFLREVVTFERAAVATLLDGRPRVVEFDYEPISVLRALAAGRMPVEAGPGRFRVHVVGDEVDDAERLAQPAAYWPH